jgi:hypothetical protein
MCAQVKPDVGLPDVSADETGVAVHLVLSLDALDLEGSLGLVAAPGDDDVEEEEDRIPSYCFSLEEVPQIAPVPL